MLLDEKLIGIVGQENFTNQLEELVPYSYDASMNVHRPDAAVWPESTEQVSKIVDLANRFKIPVVPRGAGTSLSGGVIPIRGGIIIDLSRMNRILEIALKTALPVFRRVWSVTISTENWRSGVLSFLQTLQAAAFPRLEEMLQPTLEESKGRSTERREIMSWGFRSFCQPERSCIPAPIR